MKGEKSKKDRLHDLSTVQHDFKIVSRLIRDGYTFDDDDAPKVIEQLDRSVKLLEEEIQRLSSEWA